MDGNCGCMGRSNPLCNLDQMWRAGRYSRRHWLLSIKGCEFGKVVSLPFPSDRRYRPYITDHTRPYAVLQRTLDEDCRQAEEPKQLADEASRFHLGRQRQHSAVICSGALLFSSRVLRPSLVTLCSHKSSRCAVELYHASHLWYPPFYTSLMASSALQH